MTPSPQKVLPVRKLASVQLGKVVDPKSMTPATKRDAGAPKGCEGTGASTTQGGQRGAFAPRFSAR